MQQFEFNDVMYLHRNTTADKTLNETLLGKIIEGNTGPLPTGSYTHALCRYKFFNKIL